MQSLQTPRLPTTLEWITSIRASSLNNTYGSIVSDLGPEYINVLVRDFSKNQDWSALKRMGALEFHDSEKVNTATISTISSQTAFISPPPIPSPSLIVTPRQSTRMYSKEVENDDEEEDEENTSTNKQVLTSNEELKIPGQYTLISSLPLGVTISGSTSFQDSNSKTRIDTNLSNGALGALERVQLQMRLLSAQTDILSRQADRLEAEMSQESNGIDIQRATVILSKRGETLKNLHDKADRLVLKTTNELTRKS
jgi:hypothetical protein